LKKDGCGWMVDVGGAGAGSGAGGGAGGKRNGQQ